ncbi:hypothetical protein K492DRAFT_204711 [Lichtheimia hyalospora FSU 10163]|nr:hypothetical protein K492DRAFT_204711 [Lichtheimia hyalospora FSU 10163]
MEHAEYWTPNNPHSPTHRSPELPQRTLTGIVMEQYNNNASSGQVAPTHHHHYYVQQERQQQQQQQRQYRHSYVDEQETHPSVRFQESPTTPGPTSAGDQPAFDTTGCYESTTTTSSLSTPLSSSGRPTRYAGDHLDELDFTRHGYYRHDDDDQVERLRSTLSSLNTNSAWGSVWDDYQPEYKMLQETYYTKKKDIFANMEHTIQDLRELESKFDRTKENFQGHLATDYSELCRGLMNKRNRLDREKASFEASTDHQTHGTTTFQQTDKIKLNIGGEIYQTSLSTLKKDDNSLLATMFSGRHRLVAEEDGSYFIDRDPHCFRMVLNYLRDSRIPPAVLQDDALCQELLQEAKYYRIEGLVQLLEHHET